MTKIFNFKNERKHRVEKKRRNFERIVFKNFLGAYSMIDSAGSMLPVELVDISKTGLLFQVNGANQRKNQFEAGEELNFRLYFTKESYIPVSLEVKFQAEYSDDQGNTYLRYGCEFDKSTNSFAAVEAFIKFLYKFAELSVDDNGDKRHIHYV